MKHLKNSILWFTAFGLIGAALLVSQYINHDFDNTFITSFAITVLIISIIKIFNSIRIAKNKNLLKKYEINNTEERTVMITQKAGYYAFLTTVYTEMLVGIILMFTDMFQFAEIIMSIAALQVFVYVIFSIYLRRKY